MIGKGKAISHGGKALDYALGKKDSLLIDQRFCYGESAKEIAKEFSLYQNHFPDVRNNILRFEVSPDSSDGKELTAGDWKKLSDDFLKEMNLERNPSVVILHRDTGNPHLHIVASRVDVDCHLRSDSFIGKRASAAADRIAVNMHLVRAKEVELSRKEASKGIREEIYGKFQEVRKSGFTGFDEFSGKMKSKGVAVNATINSSGEIQGYRVAFGGCDFKATDVHREMSFNKIKGGIRPEKIIIKLAHKGGMSL